jgi:hypothetical protein
MTRALLLAVAALVAACACPTPGKDPEAPAGAPAPAPTPVVVEPAPAPAAKLADGAACSAGDECASGLCEGEGCEPGQGRCVSDDRLCTTDLAPYCGCDGQTFHASSTCPARRYRQLGPC